MYFQRHDGKDRLLALWTCNIRVLIENAECCRSSAGLRYLCERNKGSHEGSVSERLFRISKRRRSENREIDGVFRIVCSPFRALSNN